MEILVPFFVLALLVAVVILWKKKLSSPPQDISQPMLLMQQQMESLRTEMRGSLQATNSSLAENLKNTSDVLFQSMRETSNAVQQNLTNVTVTVNEQLSQMNVSMNQQLASVSQQMQSQTGMMGSRLDNAARVIGDVQKNLGELGKIATEMKDVGQNVSTLSDLLRAPKFRGGFGELMLEYMLKQVLPSQNYQTQYRFKNNQLVDSVIFTAGGIIPIDAKFPLENFRKLVSVESETEKKTLRKTFLSDIKKHIDAIATKYILPDEGTLNFALMYIPAENVYYEAIIKDEIAEEGLMMYATKKHVVPVSPNSFYAYLQVIALGLKGLQVEKTAKQILDAINRLDGDFSKVRESFDILGSHLENAKKKYDESDKRLQHVEERFSNITTATISTEQSNLLP